MVVSWLFICYNMFVKFEFSEGYNGMMNRKKYNKIAVIICFICVLLLICYVFYMKRHNEKNIFIYQEHLDDIVVTVGNQPVTLKEFGYYIFKMENKIQEQALIYNPKDPMDYWNTHFSAGANSGYIFEYAWDYALADCICDLIFSKKAQEAGYSLSEDEYKQAKTKAEELYAMLSTEQIKKTGLTIDLIRKIEERRLLVQLYTKSSIEENELSGYIDNIMACISGNNSTVMTFEVICNEDMKKNIRMGNITVNCNKK